MKRLLSITLIAAMAIGTATIGYAQDAKKAAAPAAPAKAALPANAGLMRANFTSVFGTVTKIDNADPAHPKLEVKNERDGKVHTIELTPATNITKVTDISELKQGENVRVMARTLDNKETALNVSFGKIKPPTYLRSLTGGQGPGAKQTPAPAAPKK